MLEQDGLTIVLAGDMLKVFKEAREVVKDVLGLSKDPPDILMIAMLFQYGKSPFLYFKKGFSQVYYENADTGETLKGDLKIMIRNDWNFFQLQREKNSVKGGAASGGKTVH